MANGDHDWTAGETVTAANVDDYLQLQTVEKFATAAARDAALTTRKREGMLTYQDDTNTLTNYSGAAWSTIGPVNSTGLLWTPTITQSGTPGFTINSSWYFRVGRLIVGQFYVTLTGAGVAANMITVALPVTAVTSTGALGSGVLIDSSSGETFPCVTVLQSTTTLKMIGTTYNASGLSDLTLGSGTGITFKAALAAGDTIYGTVMYQAASDA